MLMPLPTDATSLVLPGCRTAGDLPGPLADLPGPLADLADALAGVVPLRVPAMTDGSTMSLDGPAAPRVATLHTAPRTAEEVVCVVRAARERHVPVAAPGGAPDAAASLDGAVLVSTASLDHLTVLPVLGRAHVGAAVRGDALTAAAAVYGLAPATATPPAEPVVEQLVGRFVGRLVGDGGGRGSAVRALDVVGGDGTLRRVPADHPQLVTALAGGRGLPGIVVAVEVDLVERTSR